jgi:hypothetical protein
MLILQILIGSSATQNKKIILKNIALLAPELFSEAKFHSFCC